MVKFSKFITLAILLLLISFLSVSFSYAQTSSTPDLQTQIQNLLKQIQALQQQVAALQAELGKQPEKTTPAGEVSSTPVITLQPAEISPPELTRFLSRGSFGDDVRKLQEFLAQDREIYPEGLLTGFFGPLTEAAVKKWQEKHGIEQVGIIGPKSIAKFQELGQGRIQQLLEQGAGASGIIPPGLLTAPGIQKKIEVSATTTPSVATTTATTTPAGVIPAVPAVPATPAVPSSGAGTAIPATPATPAVPAATSSTATTTSTADTTPPSTPTNLIATPVSASQINLSWTNSTDNVRVVNYNIKVSRSGEQIIMTTIDVVPNTAATTTSYLVTNLVADLQPSTSYTFTVTAYDGAWNASAPSSQASATTTTTTSSDTTPPSVPATLIATTLSSTLIKISWTASTDNVGVMGYKCYRNGVYLGGAIAECYFHDLTPSITYALGVAAYDAAGNTSSQATISATTFSNTAPDTIAPSVPTNLAATVASSTQINLSWSASTDNVAVKGYLIYRNSTQIANVTTGTSYSDTSLVAATTYSYTVAAYDAAGNISAQTNPVSAATLSVGPSAPTNVQVVTNSSSQEQPPIVRYYMVFDYTLQSTTQSFNIYRKRPSDASFVKYTYNAQTSVNPSILPIPGSDESNFYHRGTNQWEWWTTFPAPAPASAVGEYQFYATAVDTNGVESSPSQTKSFKLYTAPVITSPADGSTVSTLPVITVSGDPSAPSPTYGMVIYKQTTGNTAWSAWPAPSTNFTYSGPALNPSDNPHRLVIWFSSGFDRSFFATSIFNVSTTISSLDLRAKNLAAISQSLNAIKEKLIKLLQGL